MLDIDWLPTIDITQFPSTEQALDNPDGLLLIGGNLSVTSLHNAYRNGIFPWYEEDQPIMWWSPSIRAVIETENIYISKSMGKLYRNINRSSGRNEKFRIAADTCFQTVIEMCSLRRETWITEEMRQAYLNLHQENLAHSIEVFDMDNNLVGGLYGVFIGNCFCGESMFSLKPNTSKLALIALAKFLQAHNCPLIDCQMPTEHLMSMGAVEMSRSKFSTYLNTMSSNQVLANNNWRKLWQLY